MRFNPSTISIVSKAVHVWNTSSPSEVKALDSVIDFKPEQPSKAALPIDVTELGRMMVVRLVQPVKAAPSIDVTELGIPISIFSKEEQFLKTL